MVGIADRPHEELLAVKVRHRFDLGHGRVDPFKVAELLGLEVVRFPIEDGSVEGIYRPIPGGGGAILVNSASQNLRQRFTAAHEIGHSLLHGDEVFVDDELNRRSEKLKEKEADRFAGALLVDHDATEEIFERHRGDVDAAVAEIVDVFRVNVPTAAIQLQQYGLITRIQCDAFLERYGPIPLWRFMEAHGMSSPHQTGESQLSLSRAFKRRVLMALSAGQLSPERAAEFLAIDVDKLPRRALDARERVLAPLKEELTYNPDAP